MILNILQKCDIVSYISNRILCELSTAIVTDISQHRKINKYLQTTITNMRGSVAANNLHYAWFVGDIEIKPGA